MSEKTKRPSFPATAYNKTIQAKRISSVRLYMILTICNTFKIIEILDKNSVTCSSTCECQEDSFLLLQSTVHPMIGGYSLNGDSRSVDNEKFVKIDLLS